LTSARNVSLIVKEDSAGDADQRSDSIWIKSMTFRPDPTFHASPKIAVQAVETFAYTLLLSSDFSQPDALAVIVVDPQSKEYGKIVHTVTMPNTGDEFNHFGWNAYSSALSARRTKPYSPPHAAHSVVHH
jgi:hypothetical protein